MEIPDFRERLENRGARGMLHDFRYALLASIVFLFALWIRLIPRNNMEYLQALDPYMISRMSQAIVTEGHLPLMDVWRYFPYTTPTYLLNLGDIYIPAYLYHVFSPFMSFSTWTQVYPALMGALMVAAMYMAGKELFGRQTGVLAAFFLASAPAVLHRSSAGWFEKEPIASFLMITSVWLVTRAWKRKSWSSGILAGAALGIALTSWGGAQHLFILYPAAAFAAVFVEEDAEKLVASFTPMLLVANILPAILNPSRASIPSGMFLAALGVLGLVWIRYIAEEYELVNPANTRYVAPSAAVIGGFLLFLSPLYSQTLARQMQSVISKVVQNTGGVVGGTVAENQPAQAGQIIGQLGAFRAHQVLPAGIASASEFFSGWTFSLIGTSILIVVVLGMAAKKVYGTEEATPYLGYGSFFVALTVIAAAMILMLPGTPFTAFLFAFVVSVLGVGVFSLFSTGEGFRVEERWYLLIPLLWILSSLYGASQKSRLLFLTSQPVALMAGYGLSVGITELGRSSIWDAVKDADTDVEVGRAYRTVLVLILVPVLLFNGAAAFGMAQGIGGSPNQAWMENLDFMREETPVDSVILSWWDYGYWFETIGARAAIADGGNMGFYGDTIPDGNRINFPLADFLTSEDYTQHLDWMESLSVDYVVLDSSMIGKYSAVSQIHNRDNSQFNAMQTLSCRSQGNQCLTTSANNQTYLIYEGQGARFLVPFEQGPEGLSINGTPLMQTQQGVASVSNVCSEGGVREVEAPENQSLVPGCVSFHPNRQHQQLVYIPPQVMDSALVNLYIMDAHGMENFEEVFDNGYVKMWKVDYSPNQ